MNGSGLFDGGWGKALLSAITVLITVLVMIAGRKANRKVSDWRDRLPK